LSEPAFRTLQEYHTHVQQQIAQSGQSDDWSAVKILSKTRATGIIRAELHFKDGARLRFNEEIAIDAAGHVMRPAYTYHYERNAFYFRYDRAPDTMKPITHEECHIHVIQEEPRFKTHITGFDEVFRFILACFYSQNP